VAAVTDTAGRNDWRVARNIDDLWEEREGSDAASMDACVKSLRGDEIDAGFLGRSRMLGLTDEREGELVRPEGRCPLGKMGARGHRQCLAVPPIR
jgi:hypothetical protein